MARIYVFLLLLLFSDAEAQVENQDSSWFRENYYKLEVRIPMRDGVKLFTSVYVPKDSTEKHPIMLQRTPYSAAPYGAETFRNFWTGYDNYYLHAGYIMVVQDVRGRWMSEGKYADIRPFIADKKPGQTDEASDAYDAIDWLVKNIPGNNGNVGQRGTSYPGYYSSMAAASGHPALKAVSPQAPVTDWFRGDDFHHNGAFMYMDAFAFYVAGGFARPHPVPVSTETPIPDPYDSKDNYAFYLRQGAIKNLLKLAGDSMAFFKELYQHPDEDSWWQARNARVAMKNIKPAVLVTGGLFDAEDCFGAWNLYQAIVKQSPETDARIVMGPWYHGQWNSADGTYLGNIAFGSNTAAWYQDKIEFPFFNHYLKGSAAPDIARATIFFTGENKWRQFPAWPPTDLKKEKLYFHEKGLLSFSADAHGSDTYTSDPAHPVPYAEEVHFNRTRNYMTDDQRFAERRPDVVTYQTPVLTRDLTIGGPVTANLEVMLGSTDADFVVKIIDVFPDSMSFQSINIYKTSDDKRKYPMGGYEMLVRGDIFRGKYRKSYAKPEPFRPGKADRVSFVLNDVAHTFKAGHRVMVQVQSSWFPLADRNPQQFMNIYTCSDADFRKASVTILHDAGHLSNIELPVLSGGGVESMTVDR